MVGPAVLGPAGFERCWKVGPVLADRPFEVWLEGGSKDQPQQDRPQRQRRDGRRCDATAATDRHFLHGLEIDDRLVVVENRPEFVVACLREIALRLKDQEARGRAGLDHPLLRLELAFRELPRCAGALHALLVGLYVARLLADLRRHLQLLVLETRLRLAVLETRPREVCIGL